MYKWGVESNVKITRLDIAHDDHFGHQISIENAITWYEQGLFCASGRPPKRHLEDDFNDGSGKTFYVGVRGNSKFLRIYEKGKQLGDPTSPWCRAEVEFLAKDQKISWDAVINPDQYFSGAYKALSYLNTIQSRFDRIKREETIAFDQAVSWAKTNFGQLVNMLSIIYDEDHSKVVSTLRRDGIPKKLEGFFDHLYCSSENQ